MSKKRKLPADVAKFFQEKQALPHGVAEFFRQTGAEGGHARAEAMTPERRAEIAKKAAAARWEKKKEPAAPNQDSKRNRKA